MFDGNMAFTAIYTTLTNDSTLMGYVSAVIEGIYPRQENTTSAPPASAYPFINMVPQPMTPMYYNGDAVAKLDGTIAVYGIQRFENNGSYAGTLASIAERIDDLLHGQHITISESGSEIGKAYVHRESIIRERFIDLVEYRYLGGLYQISTSEK